MSYESKLKLPTFINPATGLRMPNDNGWQTRHQAALTVPKGPETPIVMMLIGWAIYADGHKRRYDSGIGEDQFLGPIWRDTGKAIRGLLDGETGRLDCGTLSAFIHDTLAAEGFGES